MPLVRITLAAGKPAPYRRAVADGIHDALVETANVPPEDRFQVVEEVPAENLVWSPSYLGVDHTPDLILVQIFLNRGRTVEVKAELYAAIAAKLGEAPGVRKQDVIVSLVEVSRENWCFGDGVMSYSPAP
jgi:phenylpyruvate tautomerase PptA (4-oxalocrotonate tautomerase family)